jgi:hypothetical protein
MIRGYSVFATLLILSVTASPLRAQDKCQITMPASTTSIHVRVLAGGKPVKGRHASLYLRKKLAQSALTTDDGQFSLSDLPLGRYVLAIEGWGKVPLVVHPADPRFTVAEFTLETRANKCPSLVAGID